MGRKGGFLDIERHFALYGAYHTDKINLLMHVLFVWPFFFNSLVFLYFTPSLFSLPQIGFLSAGLESVLVLNFGFVLASSYGLFYLVLDKKAGSLAALLCFGCWVGSSFLASYLGRSLAWKKAVSVLGRAAQFHGNVRCAIGKPRSCWFLAGEVALVALLFCSGGQVIGHTVFEKRFPVLFDNLLPSVIFAPFFVLYQVLQTIIVYEPYPGFSANVERRLRAELEEWHELKQKKAS